MKKPPVAPVPSLILGLLLAVPLPAQTAGTSATSPKATPAPTAEEVAWLNLQGAALAPAPGTRPGEQAAVFKANADLARDFYTQHPQHPKAVEARKLEAVLLIQAVSSGDTSVEGRMEATALAFRNDPAVPEALRAEVAGTHAFTGILRRELKADELRAAYADAALGLILSFPTQPQGYESLLTLASENDPVQGRAQAQELLRMPAPAEVKQNAQLLLDRLDLVGQPLGPILADAGALQAREALQAGRPTLIYTWAGWSPGSLELGSQLGRRNTGAANIIGINLDQDVAAAAALAKTHRLPGVLQYDRRGMQGALARGLKVNGAPLVYFADAQGVIRDVKGLDGLEQKLGQNGL